MTDITELAQREKFEAWLSEKPPYARYMHWCDSLNAYDYTGIQLAWEAYQAGGAELVEALEKAQAKSALVAGGIEAATKLHERIAELDAELEREREKSRRVMSRIAELESRTVKIPGWFVKDAIAVYDRDEIEEALSAAGIGKGE
ncbi:TPA: hypothetical protein R2K70_003097 [Raoultella ornithinolytica]|nr:hypothetical protein [Raoultella ornithinolytica]